MLFLPFYDTVSFRQLPPSSFGVRFGPHLVLVDDGNMSGCHDDDVGRGYLETQRALGRICGENRPILVMFLSFSSSVSFRLIPPSSVGVRFGSLLVRVSDGNMSGGQDDDIGEHIWEPNRPWAKFEAEIDRF